MQGGPGACEHSGRRLAQAGPGAGGRRGATRHDAGSQALGFARGLGARGVREGPDADTGQGAGAPWHGVAAACATASAHHFV
jgi:hypothetical protein